MSTLAPVSDEVSLIDLRWGEGFELLLRVAIIAERGYCEGIDTSEIRRLSAYRPMTEEEIGQLLTDDPYSGTIQVIAQYPQMARKRQEQLQAAVNQVIEGRGWTRLFEVTE